MALCLHELLIVHRVPAIVQGGRTTAVNKPGKALAATHFMFVQGIWETEGEQGFK